MIMKNILKLFTVKKSLESRGACLVSHHYLVQDPMVNACQLFQETYYIGGLVPSGLGGLVTSGLGGLVRSGLGGLVPSGLFMQHSSPSSQPFVITTPSQPLPTAWHSPLHFLPGIPPPGFLFLQHSSPSSHPRGVAFPSQDPAATHSPLHFLPPPPGFLFMQHSSPSSHPKGFLNPSQSVPTA